ncbi:MAG: AMP-binding protein [Rhodospirillaceae bacterium]|nr:AMP-binding protein [Rhodospirillaceae bacterium]MBT4488976.1 AMP-binding protein [Rhodospirillaceae bacterium]MBT5192762.1 AMP-binding protein [Rhodospirillaceae bacterium]MBT5898440.1 AMP-binding protein [Rhodospirillaceae bacterium]MBT7758101.1 AMP-binding protein [Rhodospirillaceae bacterium]
MPAREVCVLAYQIERWAAEKPDDIAFIFYGGEKWTWAQTLDLTRRAAKGLRDLGVKKGDHVLSWQPNNREAVLTWFALNYLGAVYVPVNTAYKGLLLEHVVKLSDAVVMVCHADLANRLEDIDTGLLRDVIITNGEASLAKHTTHPAMTLSPDVGLSEIPDVIEPWDTQYIIFTSGTTGPSKAVLSSYAQGYSMGPEAWENIDETDRTLVNLPMFHVGGTVFFIIALARGGSCFLDTHFKTDEFWQTVRENETTLTCLLGAMIPFLLKLPPGNHDKDHPLKKACCVPWSEETMAMGRRYGIDMRTTFNMTEVSSPMVSDSYPPDAGTCGKVRNGVEARVVDENDCEVAPGETGELILRTDRPWAMNHGYYKNPKATAEAWRNGWFHTGDAFKYDDKGYFYFVDRIKDAIRRRGENISSFEVEAEVNAFADAGEVAAIPVPSELGEDEVMVVVAPAAGKTVEPMELFRYLEPRMAHFMLPRYIRVVDELPKTPTQKVQKHLLKDDGITADTWDREAEGIIVRREKIGG